MAGEVVGTAFVRIKALTKGLGKEIEKSVKKGMADANLDKVGEDGGKQLGTSMGDATVDSASDRIKSRSDEFLPEGLMDDMKRKIQGGFEGFNPIPPSAEDKFRDSLRGQSNFLDNHLDDINANIEAKWPKDRDLFPSFGGQSRRRKKESSELGEALESLSGKMKNLGGGGLPNLGGFFTKAIGGVVGLGAVALPYLQDIGSGILAYGTGIVAQLGFMTTAAVGLAAAAGAAVGSALLPILPIMLAFKAESDILTEFKDSMAAASEEFMQIGLATQATLLPALDRAVFQMGELIPMFSEFGTFVGLAVGQFAELAANTLTGEKAQGRFAEILRSSLRILDIMLPTILNLGDILSGLWVAAIPASERFAATLGNMVQRWADIVNFGLNSGTLTETLNTWYERAELLGSALGNVFGALFDILSAGADSADSVFVRFDEWAERFRSFTESEVGQNKLSLIFDNALAVMREVNGVAVELIDGVFGRLDDVGGVDTMVASLQRLQEEIPGVKEQLQGFIDQIRDVNSILGPQLKAKVLQAFEELKEPLGRLVYAVLDVMRAMEESGAFEVFLDLLHILADVLSTLLSIPGFGTFIGYMLAFGGAAKIAAIALGPLLGVMSPFVGLMGTFLKLKAGHTLGQAAIGLLGFGEAAKKAAAGKAAADAISNVGGAVGTASKAVKGGGLAGALGKIGPALGFLGPWGIAAGVGIGAAGLAFHFASQDSKAFEQEVRQLTSSLGELNGGINIAAEGLEKYLADESRFQSRNQDDDLIRMGTSFGQLAEQIAEGSISYVEFADSAIAAGEITTKVSKVLDSGQSTYENVSTSLGDLARQYGLTGDEQLKLAKGDEVYKNGVGLVLDGNDDLIESFKETLEVLGESSKKTIDTFAGNAQNIRLLGADALKGIASEMKDLGDDEAGALMIDTLDQLRTKAAANIPKITGLTDAIYDQVLAQSTLADGTVDVIKQEQLLYNEQQKLYKQIQGSFALFTSNSFQINFSDAKREIFEFSNAVDGMNWENFRLTAAFSDLKTLQDSFPGVGDAALQMFDTLRGLPEAEFNAAAQVMNADAASLRDAMNGAQTAIINLQETALSKLPSIQEALDENFKVKEDGTKYFDVTGFEQSATKRIEDTDKFGRQLGEIFDARGAEAALAALQQGPAATDALATALATKPEQVNDIMNRMQTAETNLATKVRELFGPATAAKYLAAVKPSGDSIGIGLTSGITSEASYAALKSGGERLLDALVRGFKGKFVFAGDSISFVRTGEFPSIHRINGQRILTGRDYKSAGGFIGTGPFGGGPRGTDTVPAWLTPGEFVLRRSVAQAIPARTLEALNNGNPQLINMLSSITRAGFSAPGGSNLAEVTSAVSSAGGGSTFGPNSVVIYAQGTSAREVYNEFDHRVNWKLTSRGDR